MIVLTHSKKGVRQFIKKILSSFSRHPVFFVFYYQRMIAIRTNEHIKLFNSKVAIPIS